MVCSSTLALSDSTNSPLQANFSSHPQSQRLPVRGLFDHLGIVDLDWENIKVISDEESQNIILQAEEITPDIDPGPAFDII